MSDGIWVLCAGLLLVVGLGSALTLSARAAVAERLVGLLVAGAVTVLLTLVLTALAGRSAYLIVPLVLVLTSFAGTLVFTRLSGPGG